MSRGQLDPVIRRLRQLAGAPPTQEQTDAELVRQFVASRDEAAFTALAVRHGRLIRAVCRRVLGRDEEVQDAVQATLLVLARKADSIRKGSSVASWLFGVAFRIAMNAKKARCRRRVYEQQAATRSPEQPLFEAALRELQTILDEEVHRLPEKYRAPFVLCCLEGKSKAEAARELGWKEGTVSGRLAQARQRLRQRLARRGVALSAALSALGLSESAATAALPAAAIRDVLLFTSGKAATVSSSVATLAEGVLRPMLITKLKVGGVCLLSLGLIAAGTGLAVYQLPATDKPKAQPNAEVRPPGAQTDEPKLDQAEVKAQRTDARGDSLPQDAVLRFGSARWRHGGVIRGSVLSPDGKMLATAGDHSVIVWNLDTGKVWRRFDCDHGSTFCGPGLSFSPDGKSLGYVRNDFFACLWDLQTAKEIRRFERQFKDGLGKFWNAYCQFANDGKEFVLVSREAIETWNVESGQMITSVPVKGACALSPDSRIYLRNEANNAIILGDTRTGPELRRLDVAAKHDGIENGLAFSPDGKSLALVHLPKEIQLRQTAGGKVLASFPLPESTEKKLVGDRHKYSEYRITFSTDGKTLLLGTASGLIHRWDLTTGKELPPLSRHYCAVAGMHTLPDGRTLVSTGADGVIRRWDLNTGRENPEPDSYEGHSQAAYSPDGRLAAIGDTRGRVDLWDTRSGKPLRTLQQEGAAVTHLAFAPDAKLLAAAEQSGTVRFWQLPSGRPGTVWQHELAAGEWNCNGIHFSPDSRLLCVSDYPKQIRGIEVASGKELWKGGCSYGEAFSPDGATLLVAAPAGPYLTTLDATTGKQRSKVRTSSDISDNLGVMWTLAFSPSGRRLAIAHSGGALMLCDGQTGAEIRRLANHDLKDGDIKVMMGGKRANEIRALAFSPDGKWFVSAGSDTAVYIWETATGQEVLRFPGHEAEVSCVAFSPDGQNIFSYGHDGQGYLWNLKPKPASGPRAAINELWINLAETNASKAYRAIWALRDDPRAVDLLRKKLSPAMLPDKGRLAKLIADLDSNQFAVRESATKELEGLGEIAAPACRKALEQKPSAEARRRLEALIEKQNRVWLNPSSELLRTLRAIEVLEHIGTQESQQVLKVLAQGASESRLTQEAKAALERLARRPPTAP